jgi:fermentation-respiration switch protein FrsA (DUF1100 family)
MKRPRLKMPMSKAVLELIVLLIVLAAAVRLFEPRFAFFPSAGESTTPRDYGIEYEQSSIATCDGERLHGWSLAHSTPRASILYFHGNGGNLSVWAPILAGIARRGYVVVAFDYRGYGLSTGRPTERGLYRDVVAVVDRLWIGSPRTPIVYWGRSLGVAMAAYAATIQAPDGLILESGFPSVRSLVRDSPLLAFLSLFSTYRFPCAEFVQQSRMLSSVLVLHGDHDHVVPIAQGRALFERINAPKQFVTIRGGDHNDLTPSDPHAYWKAVEEFVGSLPKR